MCGSGCVCESVCVCMCVCGLLINKLFHCLPESVHTGYLLQFQSCYEAVSRSCEDEMEKCRVSHRCRMDLFILSLWSQYLSLLIAGTTCQLRSI